MESPFLIWHRGDAHRTWIAHSNELGVMRASTDIFIRAAIKHVPPAFVFLTLLLGLSVLALHHAPVEDLHLKWVLSRIWNFRDAAGPVVDRAMAISVDREEASTRSVEGDSIFRFYMSVVCYHRDHTRPRTRRNGRGRALIVSDRGSLQPGLVLHRAGERF